MSSDEDARKKRPEHRRAITICVMSGTGGRGKTSTCLHLAEQLAGRGTNVLLIGADPAGVLTRTLVGASTAENRHQPVTFGTVRNDDHPLSQPEPLAVPTPPQPISLLGAHEALARRSHETAPSEQHAVRNFLEGLSGYNVILIDCPPDLYHGSWNAMLASDHVLISVSAEDGAVEELRAVHEAVVNAHRVNPRLRLLGHVITGYDPRLPAHRTYEKSLRSQYGESVLDSVISDSPAPGALTRVDTLGGEVMTRVARGLVRRDADRAWMPWTSRWHGSFRLLKTRTLA